MLSNLIPDNSTTPRVSHLERRDSKRPAPISQGTARNIERELAQLEGLDDPGHTQGLPVYRMPPNFARLLKLALCDRTSLKSALAYLDAIGRACWRYSRPGNVDVTFMLKAMATVDLACLGRVAHASTHMRYIRLLVRASVLQSIGVRGEYNLTHFVRLNGGPDFWQARLEAKRSGGRNRKLFAAHKQRAKTGGTGAEWCRNATEHDGNGAQKQPVTENHSHKSQKHLGFLGENKTDQSTLARGDRLPLQAVSKPKPHAVAPLPRRPCEPRATPVLASQQACEPSQGLPDTLAEADNTVRISPVEADWNARIAAMKNRLGPKHQADKQAEAEQFTQRGFAASPAASPTQQPSQTQPPAEQATPRKRRIPASPATIRTELEATGVEPRVLHTLDKQRAFDMLARFGLEAVDWGFIGAYAAGRNRMLGVVRDWRAYLLQCARNHLVAHPSMAA